MLVRSFLLQIVFSSIVLSFNVNRSFFATTSNGFETILAKEVSTLPDVQEVKIGKGSVSFVGSSRSGFSGLLWLRSSLKLMEKLGDTESSREHEITNMNSINSKSDLYNFIATINWTDLLDVEKTIKCSCVLGEQIPSDLTHSHFSSLTMKNCIVDQFRERYKMRPNVDIEHPHLPLMLYLHRGEAIIYRIWSGEESMHKRGYKTDSVIHKANLRENTAASLLKLAKLQSGLGTVVVDPMCGSGTFPIEAALIACNTAPGLIKYPMLSQNNIKGQRDLVQPVPLHWKDVDPNHWKEAWLEATAKDNRYKSRRMEGFKPIIFGNDIDNKSIELAKKAARSAGVDHLIKYFNMDISEFTKIFENIMEQQKSTSMNNTMHILNHHANSSVIDNKEMTNEVKEVSNKSDVQSILVVTNPPWDMRLSSDNNFQSRNYNTPKSNPNNFGLTNGRKSNNEMNSYGKLSVFLDKCQHHFSLACYEKSLTQDKIKATAYVLSGNKELKKQIDMPPNQIKKFYMANTDVEWLMYHLN